MNLTCVSDDKVASISLTFLLVQTASYLAMPFLVRAIGMKFTWAFGALIQFLAFLAFYFTGDINVAVLIAIAYGISGSQSAFSYTFLA